MHGVLVVGILIVLLCVSAKDSTDLVCVLATRHWDSSRQTNIVIASTVGTMTHLFPTSCVCSGGGGGVVLAIHDTFGEAVFYSDQQNRPTR